MRVTEIFSSLSDENNLSAVPGTPIIPVPSRLINAIDSITVIPFISLLASTLDDILVPLFPGEKVFLI